MEENETVEKETVVTEKASPVFQTVPKRTDEDISEEGDGILKRIEENLDILSEKITSAEDSKAMYETMVGLYNSFSATSKRLEEGLNKEFNYTRMLESEIDKKKYHLDYLALKKNLLDDRVQLNEIMEKIRETLDLRLKDVDNREKTANETMDAKIQNIEKQVQDFVQTEDRMDECLKKFRIDMTKASENEYKILERKCRESITSNTQKVEEIKAAVISFLKSCEKQNEALIKKVPSARLRYDWKDFSIIGFSAIAFICLITQLFLL
ncbi:MAG: hypothetical protein K5873_06955 [Treponema sp.]|nr:hypothetical protein [Treponema sp.]